MTNKYAKKLMKLHGHRFGYCKMCGPMIYCGYCGNNCCNGMSGKYDTHANYIKCENSCDEAYEIQKVVRFPVNYRIRFRIMLNKQMMIEYFRSIYRKYKRK